MKLPADPNKKIAVMAGNHRQYNDFVHQVCKEHQKDVRHRFIFLESTNSFEGRHRSMECVYRTGTPWVRRDFNEVMDMVDKYQIKVIN